jgi:formyl-CoA transferase/CoA:oxalate CoA-transferase
LGEFIDMVVNNSPPLKGIRVLDLSRVLAGPYCSMILGDLGAEIIKVEIPGRGDDTRGYPPFHEGESAYFMSINRNKKSITLNLKEPEAREIVYSLIDQCDVVIENFRPGVTSRLGVDYETLKEINPNVIYASISSFGQTGPYAQLPGYDLIIQGMGGLMGITGEEDRAPVKIGVAITDIGAGMWATIAILAALKSRMGNGTGQYIDVSMMDGSVAWMTYMAGSYFATGRLPQKLGSAHSSIVPYQAFNTKNGRFVLIAAGNDRLFKTLCEGMGLEEVAEDPRFETNRERVENRDELIPLLQGEFMKRTRDEWIALLRPLGFPCGPVYDMAEIFSDPQVLHRDMLVEMEHTKIGEIKQIGSAMNFSEAPCQLKYPPPLLGEHTEEILKELLGYSSEKIEGLKEKGAI